VVLVFPVLTILVPEPFGARWAVQHNAFYLPPDIKAQSERNGRYLWIIKYLFLIFFVRWMALHYSLMSQTLGPRFNQVLISLSWGILGGILLILFRAAYRVVILGMGSIERQYPLLTGPKGFWLASFVLGGLSEELWRGFCIAATYETQRDITHAIIWISISFAAGRLGGLPGRIHGEVVDVACEALTGAFLACLFIFSGSVITTFVASVSYYTYLFYYLRRSSTLAPQQTLDPSLTTQTPLGSSNPGRDYSERPSMGLLKADPHSPKCPDCGVGLPYARIDIVKPFECPFCRNKLFVSPEYNKKIRRACTVLSFTLGIIVALVRNNIVLFRWSPII
jgi:hypothetical protein